MKKIKWVTLKDTTLSSAANDVTLSGSPVYELEVKVMKNDKEVREFRDAKGSEDQVTIVITMKFHWKPANYSENSSNDVIYHLKKSDNWQINDENQKVTTKPGKEAELQEAKKEAHKKLLKRYFPERIGKSKEEGEIDGTEFQYVIGDNVEGGKINVILYGKKTDAPNYIHIPWDKVKIEPKFFLTKEVDFDSVISTSFQEDGNKSKWTKGWIAFFVIFFGTIIILGIVFRKKIWRWIKGEREQEKKVREQIDIF